MDVERVGVEYREWGGAGQYIWEVASLETLTHPLTSPVLSHHWTVVKNSHRDQ